MAIGSLSPGWILWSADEEDEGLVWSRVSRYDELKGEVDAISAAGESGGTTKASDATKHADADNRRAKEKRMGVIFAEKE